MTTDRTRAAQPNVWTHVALEARARPRMSLFGKDEMRLHVDGRVAMAMGAPFPAPPPGARVDACVFGANLNGQMGAIYALHDGGLPLATEACHVM